MVVVLAGVLSDLWELVAVDALNNTIGVDSVPPTVWVTTLLVGAIFIASFGNTSLKV